MVLEYAYKIELEYIAIVAKEDPNSFNQAAIE